MIFLKRIVALLLSTSLMLATAPGAFASQTDPSAAPPPPPPPQAAKQTPEQLQQLVAPIALYPDALVAQILAAATYPAEVVEADRWMQQHSKLKGKKLAGAVDKQSWDPSVKALVQFPSVLANMDKNSAWTSSLGGAYANQSQDVMNAVQVMRARAKSAGKLTSTPQEKVTTQGQTIVIEPVNPDVVYVPQYNPWIVYGAPLAVLPGWYPSPGLYLAGPGMAFGVGFGVGFFGGVGWGWGHWGFNWQNRTVIYNHSTYIFHGGPAPGGFAGPRPGFGGGPPVGGFHGGPPPGGFAGPHPGFGGGSPAGGFHPGAPPGGPAGPQPGAGGGSPAGGVHPGAPSGGSTGSQPGAGGGSPAGGVHPGAPSGGSTGSQPGAAAAQSQAGMRSGASSGSNNRGATKANSFRGRSRFHRGFHGGRGPR